MRLAAVGYDNGGGANVDETLAGITRILRQEGLSLAGALQWSDPRPGRGRCAVILEDLASGRRTPISEDRGPEARGCHLDASALEEAATAAAASVKTGPDFVIVNRFGKQEAAGRGFRQVIEAAILLDRPVLARVSLSNRDRWEAFTGGEAEYLPPSLDAVLHWCRNVLGEQACF